MKKTIAVIICLCMMFACIPLNTLALDNAITVNNTPVTDGYYIVSDNNITSENADENNYNLYCKDNTLTLNNFNIEGDGIFADCDISITLSGINYIKSNGTQNNYCIKSNGKVTVTGSGTLNLVCDACMYYCAGIWSQGFEMTEGSLYIETNEAFNCCGIYSTSNIDIKGGILDIKNTLSTDSEFGLYSFIDVNIENADVTISTLSSDHSAVGIYCGNLVVSDSKIETTGGGVHNSSGIFASNNIDFINSKITSRTENNLGTNSGIYCNNIITIEDDSEVTVAGGNGYEYSYGLHANRLSVKNSILNATAGDADEEAGYSCGMFVYEYTAYNTEFVDSIVTSVSGSAESSDGIYSGGTIDVVRSTFTATGGHGKSTENGSLNCGICATGYVYIRDSYVEAVSESDNSGLGIYPEKGDLVLEGTGEMLCRGRMYAISRVPTFSEGYTAKVYSGAHYDGSDVAFCDNPTIDTYSSSKYLKIVPDTPETGIRLDHDILTMEVGDSKRLVAYTAPDVAGQLIWESDDENVATVVGGVVTAKGEGRTKVRVYSEDRKYNAECEVVVAQHYTLTLDHKEITLDYGQEIILSVGTYPEEIDLPEALDWYSDNNRVAIVHNGKVTPTGNGTATITVMKSNRKGEILPATCKVTVENAPDVLLVEDFESFGGEQKLSGFGDWKYIDADGDENCWLGMSSTGFTGIAYEGNSMLISESRSFFNGSVLSPDNRLVSPVIHIDEKHLSELSFYAKGNDQTFCKEYFEVYVISADSTGEMLDTQSRLFCDTTHNDWVRYTVDLSAYAGQDIKVLFRHCNTKGQYLFCLDYVLVTQTEFSGELQKLGDLNLDGIVNTADAVTLLKFTADMITLDDKQTKVADTNKDGTINTADVVTILNYCAGMAGDLGNVIIE